MFFGRTLPGLTRHLRVGGQNRFFCVLSEKSLPSGLRTSKHVVLPLKSATSQLKPSEARRGEKSIGVGDRGAGLVYRDGRPASSAQIANREDAADFPREGIWVVKIQPPLDVSSDSAGGLGKMTPATLLLNDQKWSFVRFVNEDDEGHFQLLRAALSADNQVAYRYAQEVEENGPKLQVWTDIEPSGAQAGW
eukprot:TRINITY_DN51301_c0_g1_i1.p1 TRINITY_DN51301_c0_g1~~TRINITY_DN51301_c0_g1_i1.p1  ORF type:complete len:192 (+),score=32.09 TRINITY_DN51301_c0_g1_i1:72-647(+)